MLTFLVLCSASFLCLRPSLTLSLAPPHACVSCCRDAVRTIPQVDYHPISALKQMQAQWGTQEGSVSTIGGVTSTLGGLVGPLAKVKAARSAPVHISQNELKSLFETGPTMEGTKRALRAAAKGDQEALYNYFMHADASANIAPRAMDTQAAIIEAEGKKASKGSGGRRSRGESGRSRLGGDDDDYGNEGFGGDDDEGDPLEFSAPMLSSMPGWGGNFADYADQDQGWVLGADEEDDGVAVRVGSSRRSTRDKGAASSSPSKGQGKGKAQGTPKGPGPREDDFGSRYDEDDDVYVPGGGSGPAGMFEDFYEGDAVGEDDEV